MKTIKSVTAFHGHMCPGLAIGYRVAGLALKELGKRAEDEELVAVVENNSCAVDAIQSITGCTFGKGNLIFKDYGKQVYTFIKRPSGKAVRISLKWATPEEPDKEKAAWESYTKGNRSEAVLAVVHKRRARRITAILKAADEELFDIDRIKQKPPLEARIFRSLKCTSCGETVMEPRARLKDGKAVCIPCFEGEK